MTRLYQDIDALRERMGCYRPDELLAPDFGNDVYDPFSVVMSRGVTIGSGNTIYPNVVIRASAGGTIIIGDNNVLFPGTFIIADAGSVTIGSGNLLGDGGMSIKANRPGVRIVVGNEGRYLAGVVVVGNSTLGNGSQVIGPITVEDSILGDGASFREADPDLRGGVIKGSGLARKLHVKRGHTASKYGEFFATDIVLQKHYHPKH